MKSVVVDLLACTNGCGSEFTCKCDVCVPGIEKLVPETEKWSSRKSSLVS